MSQRFTLVMFNILESLTSNNDRNLQATQNITLTNVWWLQRSFRMDSNYHHFRIGMPMCQMQVVNQQGQAYTAIVQHQANQTLVRDWFPSVRLPFPAQHQHYQR